MEKILINCDAEPFIPENLLLVKHEKMGILEFDFSRVKFLELEEIDGDNVFGFCHRAKCRLLSANVLDHFLTNKETIPEEWEERGDIYFFNTIYQYKNYKIGVVRSMHHDKGKKLWSEGRIHSFDLEFDFCVAIVYANDDYEEIHEI